ncbi:hypothetical protein B566_EDAN007429 [Ephemera danica]|nr:hypothetical protein B566_EDAN007429 [Ephemera danica]
MIEVYNENVYDLLSGNKASSKVTITMDMEGRFYPTEAKSVIQHGYKQRTKSSTLLNNTSSRSHCILRLRLVRADRAPGGLLMHMGPQSPAACDIEDTTVSTFMICDLAGAERTNKTGEAKGRARETAKINNALVVLRRLTMILQPLLSDPGPKHFLINISTSQNLLDETINVLNFSSVARKVIVTEQMRSVPHYQLPTSSKQVQAMYQSQLTECTSSSELGSTENLKASDFEEDVDMDSATDTNPPDLDYLIVKVPKDTVGTQTDPEVVVKPMLDANATQTEEVPDIKKPRLEDRETQTIELIEVDESEVAALKAKIAAAEKLVEENETRHRQRERELFAEFDKLEHEMKEGQKEQLQVKEQQLYSLMEERLQILKTFYKEKVDDMTEKHHELMSKVAAADKAKEDTELVCEFTSTSLIEKREENVKITEECETANEAYNKDVKNLEKDVKNTLANLMEMENKAEKMEKSTSKYKARCDNLMSKLAETNHELERFRKIAQFLVDSFRPDLRQSLAGSADEEKIWSSLLKEMKAIPSQFVLLKTENCQLKECLQLKKELETTKNQKEEYKRESQKLVQRMMNMTPRKQDDTPQKEFKTPLTPRQQSVTANATLKMSAQKELKTPQKEEEEPEVKEVRSSARKTRNTRKTPVRGSSAAKENLEMLEEEAVKPAQKPRRRRLLNSKSLHPALDVDEVPLDIDVTTTSQLSETKRKLRAKYK